MKCPHCAFPDSKVIDSRPTDGGGIRRRRECLKCKNRFTTYETYEVTNTLPLVVIKKDNSLQLFDRNKILTGLLQACYKRPVDPNEIVNEIESELQNSLRNEITTNELGEIVMYKLKETDDVAYVRFASVYREFKDIDTFLKELDKLKK
jgi:transcriptional repressor NrdR